MATLVYFRFTAIAFVVLALSVLTPAVGRCAGQKPGPGVAGPAVPRGAEVAKRAAEGRASAQVLAAQLRGMLLLVRDPDEAYAHLKGILDAIRTDPDLSEPCREKLQSRLEWAFWGVETAGPFIKDLETRWLALKAELRIALGLWRFERQR
jgi:hypothetical protein